MSDLLRKIIIIGVGQGGFQAAVSLRQAGSKAQITLIGEEPSLPYQRPPLSKAFMQGGEVDRLLLRKSTYYAENGITLLLGRRVSSIDRSKRTIATIDGEIYPYDHLILATGARNAIPPIAGVGLPGIHKLRTLEDAAGLRRALHEKCRAIIIGGGFIGLEFAAVARMAGIEVTVVEAANQLMARIVSPEMARRFAAIHESMGVDLLLGRRAVEILAGPDGHATGVRLDDGTERNGDLLLLAAGVTPNVELALAADLDCDNGIVVNSHLQTADPAIAALGDCAAFPDPITGQLIRLESVQAATDHARTIAKCLIDTPIHYDAVPWFWSDQAEWKLQIAGLAGSADNRIECEGVNGAATVLRFDGDRLSCVETVNTPADHIAARRLLSSNMPILKSEIEAHRYSLSDLLKSKKAASEQVMDTKGEKHQ